MLINEDIKVGTIVQHINTDFKHLGLIIKVQQDNKMFTIMWFHKKPFYSHNNYTYADFKSYTKIC